MKEPIVSFDIAKKLKVKGFKIPCHSYYFEDGNFKENEINTTNGYYGEPVIYKLEEFYNNWNDDFLTKKNGDRCFGCSKNQEYFETYSAPTLYLAQQWLREEYNSIIDVVMHSSDEIEVKNNFDSKTDFYYYVEVNYYGKNFEISQTDDADYLATHFTTYESALEAGIDAALDLI